MAFHLQLLVIPTLTLCSPTTSSVIATIWSKLLSLAGDMSTASHPQSNSQSEATNNIIDMYLRCLTCDHPWRGVIFQLGEWVWLHLMHRPLTSLDNHALQAIQNHWYTLYLKIVQPVCSAAQHGAEPWPCHAASSISTSTCSGGKEKMLCVLPHNKHASKLCASYLVTKEGTFPKAARYRIGDMLDLVHSDLREPIIPVTHKWRQYSLLLVDNCSHFMWLQLLAREDEAAATIKGF
jgi:hypothetical protein